MVETPGFVMLAGDGLEMRLGSGDKVLIREAALKRFAPRQTADLTWFDRRSTSTLEFVATGTALGADLRASHLVALPGLWSKGLLELLGMKSGIWLADDAFLELSRTQHTGVDLGLRSQAALKSAAAAFEKTGDPNFVVAAAEFATSTLPVNGQATDLPVIRARNWYGEFTVLNDRENPLILKFTLDPASDTLNKQSKEFLALRDLVSYEVISLRLSSRK